MILENYNHLILNLFLVLCLLIVFLNLAIAFYELFNSAIDE